MGRKKRMGWKMRIGKEKDEQKSECNGWVELKVEGLERRTDTSDDERD